MKRVVSLVLAAVAFVGPPVWAGIQASRASEIMRGENGWVCGMPILGIYLVGLVGSAALSAVSLAFGVLAYRGLPMPRSVSRKLELAVVGLPFFLACGVFLLIVVTGA